MGPAPRRAWTVAVLLAVAWFAAASAAAGLMTVRDRRGRLVVVNGPAGRSGSRTAAASRVRSGEISTRVRLYDAAVNRAAATHGLSPRLIQAVMQVESGCNPRAVSHKGAGGLMQLMPDTARDMGVGDVFDPDQNIHGGARYLRLMLDTFDQDLTLALAAYNAGPDTVRRVGAVPAIPETRNYVRKVRDILGLTGEGSSASYLIFQPGQAPSVATLGTARPAAGVVPAVQSWKDDRGVLHITNVGGRRR